MATEKKLEQLVKEVRLFIQYAVPENEMMAAVALLEKYRYTPRILHLLREHYTTLPEAREEGVISIANLMSKQDVQLLVVSTASNSYLYVVSTEKVFFLGEYLQEVHVDVLNYFEFLDQKSFLKQCPAKEKLKEFVPEQKGEQTGCPACGVSEGEYHLLGCSVEICPWCMGHLSNCNCRFEQLGSEELEDDEKLESFIDLLNEKGRILYSNADAPAYPGTSEGLDT